MDHKESHKWWIQKGIHESQEIQSDKVFMILPISILFPWLWKRGDLRGRYKQTLVEKG